MAGTAYSPWLGKIFTKYGSLTPPSQTATTSSFSETISWSSFLSLVMCILALGKSLYLYIIRNYMITKDVYIIYT